MNDAAASRAARRFRGQPVQTRTVQLGVERTSDVALNRQEYIDDTVKRYGIDVRRCGQQIQAVYKRDLVSAGMSRAATPNVVEIGTLAMSSPEESARTPSHELSQAGTSLWRRQTGRSSPFSTGGSRTSGFKGRPHDESV